ncbi:MULTISPECIES: NAD(P)-dependent oxidoreductase [Arcobacter]|uniref:3-hydroxyisobutyrate dehydrogenase family beta-hydroxyacid dehydrogenase n=1 Tax=Arcobacter defluvii TaxID=873191 RepID=A0AAE7BBF4_9BACT|nr:MULTISPECIES: NAD(P)-dependent oxidoreductase [Arcobacter]QKF76380.1 3-hydroxyisobutyrate dehydrogenase family beta-hydroxyacid dehydrogenase [Arcobacter defluvii]RXI34531.1 NAD(P)-dependent oxidoreductase [Arcobacter defluvii]BAK72181.1 3-hydroxyisobutyrate dehydrogenase [Arcobacter sp. L]
MKIGFIGLGNLGQAICKRLSDVGETLIVYNRNKEKIENLPYEKVDTPRELLLKSDVIFMCLFDSDAVSHILSRENGLLCDEIKGKTIIDLTTNDYKDVLEFHDAINSMGGNYLENPVFGSVAPALKGELTVVSSGKEEIFKNVKPILEKIAKEIFYLPVPSSATKMKLINNLCLGSFMVTIAECTAMAESCDINKSKALEILGVGGGQSLVLKAKTQKLIDEDFSAHFSNNAINKDLHLLQNLAYELKKPLFSAAIPKELFSKMKMLGKGDEDFSSIYQLFKN